MKRLLLYSTLFVLLLSAALARSQNFSGIQGATPVQPGTPFYTEIPITATAAVNNQTTLTVPAPAAGLYNYICYLSFTASQDGTSGANTNLATTQTNFSGFVLKYSLAAVANTSYNWSAYWGTPSGGCVKSAQSATSTTFVSPTAQANTAFTWYATYYQAP